MRFPVLILTLALAASASAAESSFILVLGIAQDGGSPQAGTKQHAGWNDPAQKRMAACLALVDPATGRRWLFDATPDFREQLHRLDTLAAHPDRPGLAGIFLTHAHMGHYTGLMHLGYEAMGADSVAVYAMPRMAEFLRSNGPWSQLVSYGNIALQSLADGVPVRLNARLTVTPLRVPHRQEYSEVVGFRIDGPVRSVLFLPDIDSWEEWDVAGTRLEDLLASVDAAYVDATFFDAHELPGRDTSGIPHPTIRHTMDRLAPLPAAERAKVRFIHLNHTNPALRDSSAAMREIEARGFRRAVELERLEI